MCSPKSLVIRLREIQKGAAKGEKPKSLILPVFGFLCTRLKLDFQIKQNQYLNFFILQFTVEKLLIENDIFSWKNSFMTKPHFYSNYFFSKMCPAMLCSSALCLWSFRLRSFHVAKLTPQLIGSYSPGMTGWGTCCQGHGAALYTSFTPCRLSYCNCLKNDQICQPGFGRYKSMLLVVLLSFGSLEFCFPVNIWFQFTRNWDWIYQW